MDERNIKGVIISVLMIIVFTGILFFIMNNDKKRVESIDTSEEKKIIKERQKEDSKEEEEEVKEEKELSSFKSFELSYKKEDDSEAIYYVKLDEDRNLVSQVEEKCIDRYDCSSNKENYNLIITDYEYKMVIDLYNKLYTNEWPKNSKELFVTTVSYLAGGNKELYSNNTNGWGMYKSYDINNDGKVLYREYATYVLESFTY